MNAETLWTARLRLEPIAEQHADRMVGVLADKSLYIFTGGEPPKLRELLARYRTLAAGSGRDDEVWHNWIVHRLGTDEPIGYVQATVTGATADVAWVIGTNHQGNGFATEAAAVMCQWLQSDSTQIITAHIHPNHVSSQRVAEQIGLAETGNLDPDGEAIWVTPGASPTPDQPASR